MSAIGDYIHLTAAGYNKYGIMRNSKTENNSSFYFPSARDKELKKIKASLKDSVNIQKMETQLNNFFTETRNGEQSEITQNVLNAVLEQMNEKFNKTLGNISVGTGDITVTKEMRDNAISQLKTFATKSGAKRLSPSQVKNKVDQLQQVLNKLQGVENTQAEELEQMLKNIELQMKNLYGEIIDTEKIPKGTKAVLNKEKNLKSQINKAIKAYAASPAVALQKGDFFEFLVPYVLGTANEYSIKEITDMMNDLKVGGHSEDMTIKEENFGIVDDEGEIQRFDFDEDVLEIKKSQGKIDVNIIFNNDNIGASLKNINLSKKYGWIHTVSGSNLLFFLQDIEPVFVNHYLNLNAQHSSSKMKNEKGNDKINITLREQSRLAMRSVLAAKALTGTTFGRKGADIFIVNDNKKGKVRIVNMSSIIDALNTAKKSIGVSVKLDKGEMVEKQPLFLNRSVAETDTLGKLRISKLLNSLRYIELSSSIKNSFFISVHNKQNKI